MKFKYFWIAEYWDGTTIEQYRDNGEIQWKDVDKSQLKVVSWAQKKLFGIRTVIKASVNLECGDIPIICRRNHIGIGISSMKEKGRRIEYLLGKNGEYIIKLE